MQVAARQAQAMTLKWATRADKQASLDTHTGRYTHEISHMHTLHMHIHTYIYDFLLAGARNL